MRPYTQPQPSTSSTKNTKRRPGRPPADVLIIKYIIYLPSNGIPKLDHEAWKKLQLEGFVIENVKIVKTDTPETNYNKIRDEFEGRLDDQKFKLYGVNSGKPGDAQLKDKVSDQIYFYFFFVYLIEMFSFSTSNLVQRG